MRAINVAMAAVAVVAVGGAAAVVGGGSSSAATTTTRTATVKRGVVQETVSGSGNLEAVKQSDLSFDQAGEITRVYVSEGEHVDVGEALLRLQPTDTTQDVTWIRAPFSGTVASLGVAKGDSVSGSGATDSSAQVTLAKLSKYDLQVSLSESDIGKVEKGQLATVTVSATGEELAARVVDVGVLASSSSSDSSGAASSSSSAVAYPVTLRLTQTSKDLKPGMTATADIVTAQSTGLTVPTQALRGNTLTLSTGATARVQTGVKGDSTTEIVSGVKAGDKVVVTSTSAAAGANATGSASGQQQQSQRQNGFGGGGGGFGAGGPPAGGGAPPAGFGG